MKLVYINLDAQAERKKALEESFARCCQVPGWHLQRFSAVDSAYVAANRVPGTISSGAKGCFLSHEHILQANLGNEEDIFMLEDDALFSPKTFLYLPQILESLRERDWDILFTDTLILEIPAMISLINMRRRLMPENEVTMFDLAGLVFAGSTAYVVNGRSKRKVSALLDAVTVYDAPYDLVLRKLIHEAKLKAYACFPFLTSVSEHANASQIQPEDGQLSLVLWNTFRRMIWIDRSLDENRALLEKIEARMVDDETRLFGSILMAMASPGYKPN